nr:reverse transcriptase domain-containing protein [Tanacetum cinerariifolium]
MAQTQILIYEPVVAPKPKPTIPYPSRVNKQKLREKDDNLALKFVKNFRNLHFELSFADALLHMPKLALMFKGLLNNKEKLFDLATTLINKNCSAVILKKLPEKLGDPGKFVIPSDFPEFDECLTLADLGASINLMPLSIWKKISLPGLTSTQMILEFADRSTTRPAGIAEDVFVKVGMTVRALIDVYGEELTLRVDDEAITFKVGQTSKYSYNDAESINRVDVIDIACEEYVQEGGDFILEEIEACLTSESIPTRIVDTGLDLERDIHLLEDLLNNDPSLSHVPLEELNVEDIKIVKSSIDEPPKLELKELSSHLEYAYLEGTDKLPVIIAKGLKDNEKEALLKDDFKPTVQSQRQVNPKIHEVIKKEVIKLLDAGLIYPISDSPWVSPVHCVPKKGGITVVENENNELIPTRLVTGWIVYTDHSDLKYLLNKQDAKPRLTRWVLFLQEFDIIIRDKKGTENLAADHLSRLENPYKDVLENKDINTKISLETLGKISSESASWFADFANYHARNFIVKGMSSQQKRNSLRTLNTIFGTTPICLRFVGIKSFDGVCMAKKLMISSKLVMNDVPRAIMVPILLLRKYLMPISFGPLFTEMPMTWSHSVTLINVKAKFSNMMKCLKMQFKFAKFLTFGASILWDHFRLLEEINISSWPLTICPNG